MPSDKTPEAPLIQGWYLSPTLMAPDHRKTPHHLCWATVRSSGHKILEELGRAGQVCRCRESGYVRKNMFVCMWDTYKNENLNDFSCISMWTLFGHHRVSWNLIVWCSTILTFLTVPSGIWHVVQCLVRVAPMRGSTPPLVCSNHVHISMCISTWLLQLKHQFWTSPCSQWNNRSQVSWISPHSMQWQSVKLAKFNSYSNDMPHILVNTSSSYTDIAHPATGTTPPTMQIASWQYKLQCSIFWQIGNTFLLFCAVHLIQLRPAYSGEWK